MNRIQIVTDSTADIPAGLAAKLNIAIVPCIVYVGQEAYRDGVDLSPQRFYDRLAIGDKLVRTAQPPVSEFASTYRRLLDGGQSEGILSIHVASSLSGTVNAAWAAAQLLPDPSRVEVVDSGQLSMGLGWAAIQAARLARQGGSQTEISQATHELLPRLRTAAMLNTLESLYQGGRISQISAVLGTALQIKPLLAVENGHVWLWGKVRTRSRALKQLVAQVQSWGPLAEMAILHTRAEPLAQTLAGMLQGLGATDRTIIGPAGPALTTHLGLGAVGVCALVAAGA
jgi:DegV family protein with EDD domain